MLLGFVLIFKAMASSCHVMKKWVKIKFQNEFFNLFSFATNILRNKYRKANIDLTYKYGIDDDETK